MIRNNRRAREMRRLIVSITGILLIFAGLSLALFPFITNLYTRYILAEPVEEEIAALLETMDEAAGQPGADRDAGQLPSEGTTPPYPDALLPEPGVLKIPSLELMLNIGYGVELRDLSKAPGFYPQSGYPANGNVSIAGHRTTYGAPFRHVDRLAAGDEIILYYRENIYIYSVERVFDTHTRDWSVIVPTTQPALTLTTCHPPGWATRRLVVRAYLQESKQAVW